MTPDSPEPRSALGGFADSVKGWLANAVGTTRSRVDVFTNDVEERLFRFLARLLWSLVAFICLSLGFFLAMLTIVFGFDLPPKYALGIPAVVLLLVGLVAVLMVRLKKRPKPGPAENPRRR